QSDLVRPLDTLGTHSHEKELVFSWQFSRRLFSWPLLSETSSLSQPVADISRRPERHPPRCTCIGQSSFLWSCSSSECLWPSFHVMRTRPNQCTTANRRPAPKIVASVKAGDCIEIPQGDITDWHYM